MFQANLMLYGKGVSCVREPSLGSRAGAKQLSFKSAPFVPNFSYQLSGCMAQTLMAWHFKHESTARIVKCGS
eukprot:1144852-Pelagomonas_calceolata.AAC.2